MGKCFHWRFGVYRWLSARLVFPLNMLTQLRYHTQIFKTENCHDEYFVVIGDTIGCHNPRCYQWWQWWVGIMATFCFQCSLPLSHRKYYFDMSSWWRHRIEAFSALLPLCVGNSPVTGEFPSQRPVTRSLVFSLIYAWTNGWVNTRDAGGLKCHRAHCDVNVMWISWFLPPSYGTSYRPQLGPTPATAALEDLALAPGPSSASCHRREELKVALSRSGRPDRKNLEDTGRWSRWYRQEYKSLRDGTGSWHTGSPLEDGGVRQR